MAYYETPTKGTEMTLKRKIAEIKTKIEDNTYKIVAVSSTISGAAALGLVFYYKHKLEEEYADHTGCHNFTAWVKNSVDPDGKKSSIYLEDGQIHIHDIAETEE